MNINLHVERLVLDGITLEPHQRVELKTVVETELSHLLASNGIGSSSQLGSDVHSITGGLISIEGKNEPTHLGQKIGMAVYLGIAK